MDEDFRKRIDEAVARFRAGESDVEEVEGPDGILRLVRDPASPHGFRVEAEREGELLPISIRSFPASPTRPADFPPGIPFVENCAALFDAGNDRVIWMNPSEPERQFQRLVDASLQDGWEKVELHPVRAHTDGRYQAEFRMPGRGRTLILQLKEGMAILELRERHPPE